MSTARRKLTKEEIERAFADSSQAVFPPVLTTKQAARLLGITAKTLNDWKNRGYLDGTYRQQRKEDRYWRDRLVDRFFNGPSWDEQA